MHLSAGMRLGPYEILAFNGGGGMGEVYRARDTRLKRSVAIKILTAGEAEPRLMQRFEREARMISALNHPHICALHDIGSENGIAYLVMEYCEGDTLAQRLHAGPLPLEEALQYGIEIAEALHAAHRQGIVHRDLKPANVMITNDGIKLLDFGLARAAVDSRPVATDDATAEQPLTERGGIVGTIPYMAPETLAGTPADNRSDIYALGLVLYEMVTGARPDVVSSGAAVAVEPQAPGETHVAIPAALSRIISTCLKRKPEERWQSAYDIALQLRWVAGSETAVTRAGRKRRLAALSAILLVATLVSLVALLVYWRTTDRKPEPLALTVPVARLAPDTTERINKPVLSPDGTRIAYVASADHGEARVAVRNLRTGVETVLDGTEEAAYPFWSPDGTSLGYVSNFKIRVVRAEGGAPRAVCDVDWMDDAPTWSAGNVILFAHLKDRRLMQVSATGGTPVAATKIRSLEVRHQSPQFISDDGFLMSVAMEDAANAREGIYHARLDGSEPRLIVPTPSRTFAATENALIVGNGRRVAVYPFAAAAGEITGRPRIVNFPVAAETLSVSANGHVVVKQSLSATKTRLQWFDRHGRLSGQLGAPDFWGELAFSPDGRLLAAARNTNGSLVIFDLERDAQTTLPVGGIFPVWNEDGSRIVFIRQNADAASVHFDMHMVRADGVGKPEPLLTSPANEIAWDISGERLLCSIEEGDASSAAAFDLRTRTWGRLSGFPPRIARARFSSDGEWIIYDSTHAGRREVYLQRRDGTGTRLQVSTDGGEDARWRGDDAEVYYVDPLSRIVAVALQRVGDGYSLGTPQVLFEAPIHRSNTAYDVTKDGKRFLIRSRTAEESAKVWYLVDWLK